MLVSRLVAALAVALLSTGFAGVDVRSAFAAEDQRLVSIADAGVYSGSPNTNDGTSTAARVDSSAGADRPWYLRFPAPTVPAGNNVIAAKLRVYTVAISSGYTSGPAVSVADTAGTWGETTITYANRPAAGTKVAGSASAGPVGDYTEVPLKGYNGGVVSLLVRATDNGSAYFYSRESSAGHPPELVVTTRQDAVQPNLSPASGAWLGWYLSGNANPIDKEAAYGRQADAFRRYYSMSQSGSWPTASDVAVAQADGGRRILFASVSNRCYGACPSSINGKPIPAPGLVLSSGNPAFDGQYYTPAQISSGALNPLIDAQAARIKASGLRFVLDLMHEVDSTTWALDDTVVQSEYGGMTQRDWYESTFAAAYRYWADRLKANGVTNIVFAIDYAGFRSDNTAYTRTYPGDSYVDWIAWDPYDFGCNKGGVLPTWRRFYDELEAGMLGAGARNESYALFETGVGPADSAVPCPTSYRVTWVNGMAEAAVALSKIKAVLYFNKAATGFNLDFDSAVLNAWNSENKAPYFNQPHA